MPEAVPCYRAVPVQGTSGAFSSLTEVEGGSSATTSSIKVTHHVAAQNIKISE
jgi:hypothetical protein